MGSTLLQVLLGVFLLGGLTGFLGVFPFLRQQSLLADALSHAMLPGIALTFLISNNSSTIILLTGSVCMGLCTAFIFMYLERHTHLKRDALLGILLSTFFGLGILLISLIQKKAYAHSAVIQRFFFGNASTITSYDIKIIIFMGIVCLVTIFIFWKEIHIFLFDTQYTRALGYPVIGIERLLLSIFVIALSLGLPIAGVILMSSFLIAPVAAARQWVSSVYELCILSAIIGAFSATIGGLISYYKSLPTGPIIVICLTISVLFSLLFSPSRGILRNWFV